MKTFGDTARCRSTLVMLALLACAQNAAAEDCPPGQSCEGTAMGAADDTSERELRFDAPPPPPPKLRRQHALSLRVSQLLLSEDDTLESSYLTGVGVSFRARPMRWFAIEPGIDVFTGYDEYDTARAETNINTDLLFYLNPRDAVQVFGLLGGSLALASHSEYWAYEHSTHLGAHAGLGLEFRVTRLLSFNVNAIAFSRELVGAEVRTLDDDDPRKRVPHSSGGLMLRGGTGFYF